MQAHKESWLVNGTNAVGEIVVGDVYSRARWRTQSRPRWIAEADGERLRAFQVRVVDDDHGNGLGGFSGRESDCTDSGFVITARRSHPVSYVTIQRARRIAGTKAYAGRATGVAAPSDVDVNRCRDFSASV